MIKISAVSYLNTIPFIYGINSISMLNQLNLYLDSPVMCANKLVNGDVDIGLIPVVSFSKVPHAEIISDYCIGSYGKVDTVCLYSDVPISEIKNILLDYQSFTSIQLLKVLLEEYWNISPNLVDSKPGFEDSISGNTAGLVIGDRAFNLNRSSPYIYDLSFFWKELTGLPFVFAVWVANKKFSSKFIDTFNTSLAFGLENINKAIRRYNNSLEYKDCYHYLTNNISYNLDVSKKKAMNLFLSKIKD